jgi:hypothetical protein
MFKITITITDSNDNAPLFTQPTTDGYRITVVDNWPIGTTVMQVRATDSDTGSNGKIVYSINGDIGIMKMDRSCNTIS